MPFLFAILLLVSFSKYTHVIALVFRLLLYSIYSDFAFIFLAALRISVSLALGGILTRVALCSLLFLRTSKSCSPRVSLVRLPSSSPNAHVSLIFCICSSPLYSNLTTAPLPCLVSKKDMSLLHPRCLVSLFICPLMYHFGRSHNVIVRVSVSFSFPFPLFFGPL